MSDLTGVGIGRGLAVGPILRMPEPLPEPADAASILGVISLGIQHGDEVTLHAEGETAESVLDGLAAFLGTDHDA